MTDKYLKVLAEWDGGSEEEWFEKQDELYARLYGRGLQNLTFRCIKVDYPPLRLVKDTDND